MVSVIDHVKAARFFEFHRLHDLRLAIDRDLNSPDPAVRAAAARNTAITPEQLDRVMNDPSPVVQAAGARNPQAEERHLLQALRSPTPSVALSSMANRGLAAGTWFLANAAKNCHFDNVEIVSAMATLRDYERRHGAVPGFKSDQHDVLEAELVNPDPAVRASAARNPALSKTQLDRMLRDPEPFVVAAAASNPSADERQLLEALRSPSPTVALAVMANRGLSTGSWFIDNAEQNCHPDNRAIVAAAAQVRRYENKHGALDGLTDIPGALPSDKNWSPAPEVDPASELRQRRTQAAFQPNAGPGLK